MLHCSPHKFIFHSKKRVNECKKGHFECVFSIFFVLNIFYIQFTVAMMRSLCVIHPCEEETFYLHPLYTLNHLNKGSGSEFIRVFFLLTFADLSNTINHSQNIWWKKKIKLILFFGFLECISLIFLIQFYTHILVEFIPRSHNKPRVVSSHVWSSLCVFLSAFTFSQLLKIKLNLNPKKIIQKILISISEIKETKSIKKVWENWTHLKVN